MKKIIALAVAGAFVAPAMAAEVSVSGVVEYQYRDNDGTTTSDRNGDTPAFTISGTSTTDAGYTVTGAITWDGDFDNDQLTVAGDFGSVAIGNPDGALDSFGDYTDIAPEKGGFAADGTDQFITIKPNLGINGVSVALSMQPATTGNSTGSNEGNAAALEYNAGSFTVYMGQEKFKGNSAADNDTTQKTTAYGFKTTVGGLYIAAESGSIQNSGVDSTEAKFTGLAAKYSLDKITLGVEKQDSDSAFDKVSSDADADDESTVAKFDMTTAFISYDFGGGLSAYVEQYDEKVGGGEQTTMGVKYAF